MGGMRLQKYLAQCGVASRRKSEMLIVEKRVRVNGVIASELGTSIQPGRDIVTVDGKEIRQAQRGIMLLHKPRGVVSTLKDPHGRPSIDRYITKNFQSYFPVGRLDFESTGLVILTNDGDLADRLLHPRYALERVYEVEVEGAVTRQTLQKLQRGVVLEDGPVHAKVYLIDSLDNRTHLKVSIAEGRNRIVRRMMDHVGHPVVNLVRISHGPFRLGRLKAGDVKRLSEREYLFYRRRIMAEEIKERKPRKKVDKHYEED